MEKYTALVCGGSGRVGSTIASTLGSWGANVAVQYHSQAGAAAQVVADISAAGAKSAAFKADLSNEAAVQDLVKSVEGHFGSLHILVNAMHGQFDPKDVADMGWQDWDVHLAALKAHFLICKAVLPVMRRQRHGRIIYISAGLSRRLFRGCSAYSAVKAGLNAFSKTLALEEGQYGITVNIVAPGKVVPSSGGPSTDNPQAWEELNRQAESNAPLRRHATAEDVAAAVLGFASPQASGITGQTVFVAGGEIMP